MSRAQIIDIAKHTIAHAEAGTIEQTPDVLKVPAANYYDADRFKQETDLIFKRVPLLLAPTAELANPGDYKTMDAVGVPILLVRGTDGEVRAFINSCTHRGTGIAIEETGNTKRFVCPYHGWTFNHKGDLIGIASREDFGEIDTSCYGLTALPVLEKAGLIWAIVTPDSKVDIDAFLSGYDDLLDGFGFKNWTLFSKRTIKGPNWKIAYDGYLDLYHLPVLHRDTFGADISNQALYYAWGPHQRVTSPSDRHMGVLSGKAEETWDSKTLMMGVWTVFPHISIASFDGGGRSVMLSQLFPGETAQESFTTQYYLMETTPTKEQEAEAEEQFKLLEYVVEVEDYGTGLRQQKALMGGGRDHVLFGRNEGGGQRFHGWVDSILEAKDDDALNALFAAGERGVGITRSAAE